LCILLGGKENAGTIDCRSLPREVKSATAAGRTNTILFQQERERERKRERERERSILGIERSSAVVTVYLIIDQHGSDASLNISSRYLPNPSATTRRRQCSVGRRRSPLAERDDCGPCSFWARASSPSSAAVGCRPSNQYTFSTTSAARAVLSHGETTNGGDGSCFDDRLRTKVMTRLLSADVRSSSSIIYCKSEMHDARRVDFGRGIALLVATLGFRGELDIFPVSRANE
jgi:hypothetical protein